MEEECYSGNTIYGTRAALLAYFKFAIENGVASNNPVNDARVIKKNL